MTPAEFREMLGGADESAVLDATLRSDATPYVFDLDPPKWDAFRTTLSEQLDVDVADIRVVGSGRHGFSMKPDNNLRAYLDTSDIDVVIVNARAFDRLWYLLLAAAYPRDLIFGKNLETARKELYTGYMTPVKIGFDNNLRLPAERTGPFLQQRTLWFDTLQAASQFPPRRHEGVNCRLYRSWRHAELYTMQSLSALKKTLQP